MLTDTQIRNTKPEAKIIKLTDSHGLYLEVTPSGSKHWRFRFRLDGKESLFSIGEYPHVKAAEARRLRDEARLLVKIGVNPTHKHKQDKTAKQYERAATFEAVAAEWYEASKIKPSAKTGRIWSTGYAGHVGTLLPNDINPHIGKLPIKDIKTPAIYNLLRKIEARQAPTRALLARQIVGSVFKLAIKTSRAEYNVVDPLKGDIARCVVEHRKHLKGDDLPGFLRKLEDYTGHMTTSIALKLLLLTAVRPGELCEAAWAEFNFDQAEWWIPVVRMKMGKQHIVPLSPQALVLLYQLRELTGHEKYLFPAQGTKSQIMPTATLRNAVAKLGFSDRFSPHGARGTFSTMCNEAGFRPDVIERQLAHAEQNKVRASYNQAEYMPERRKMMDQWGHTLDALKAGANIIPFVRAA
ncbi:tyrosine-type recombinase/integrase [Candidatus Nitrotoga arctica]|uniref:Integrase n=1 Tax=Candidatus Nitrotoga arctica TaxID=453162 RepID=A0ABN8AQP3_9PROT|nr:integrase arm-type DNA-binding domain-containing protein [Candidatus Nitrotoga arctica]CAG9933053.1 Integrase [Candidatus Nitrotoga arctica]